MTQPGKTLLGLLCVALWIGLLIAGLWPFNFFPPNHVQWLPDKNGVHFDRYGEIWSPAEWVAPETASEGFSLELWVGTPETYQAFVPFLSIDSSLNSEKFMIEQFRSNLIVEGQFRDHRNRLQRERIWLDDALRGGNPRFLTITSGPPGTAVYLEGAAQRPYPNLRLTPSNLSGRLLIGHAVRGHHPWTGDLLGLAFYRKTLSAQEVSEHYQAWLESRTEQLAQDGAAAIYPFDEHTGMAVRNHAHTMPDLVLPEKFRILHRLLLEVPANPNRSDLADGVVNILGFIPFGVLVATYLQVAANYSRGKSIVTAIILGGGTSLVIELLQTYLPTRDSSLPDLINNTVGSALGTLIPGRFFLRYLPRGSGFSAPPPQSGVE